jgi:hypothetical protein
MSASGICSWQSFLRGFSWLYRNIFVAYCRCREVMKVSSCYHRTAYCGSTAMCRTKVFADLRWWSGRINLCSILGCRGITKFENPCPDVWTSSITDSRSRIRVVLDFLVRLCDRRSADLEPRGVPIKFLLLPRDSVAATLSIFLSAEWTRADHSGHAD